MTDEKTDRLSPGEEAYQDGLRDGRAALAAEVLARLRLAEDADGRWKQDPALLARVLTKIAMRLGPASAVVDRVLAAHGEVPKAIVDETPKGVDAAAEPVWLRAWHNWLWVSPSEPDICRDCGATANGMNAHEACPGSPEARAKQHRNPGVETPDPRSNTVAISPTDDGHILFRMWDPNDGQDAEQRMKIGYAEQVRDRLDHCIKEARKAQR